MRTTTSIVVLGLGALLGGASAHVVSERDHCWCEEAKRANGWCDVCAVGFAAGVRIDSRALVDALDLHGHEVDVVTLECASCRMAADADGFCARCTQGVVDGKIYRSRLTYRLALGTPARPPKCPTCERAAAAKGWCEPCATGWVGWFSYADPSVHAAAAREYDRLLHALGMLRRCESCALACALGSSCPSCGISYRRD